MINWLSEKYVYQEQEIEIIRVCNINLSFAEYNPKILGSCNSSVLLCLVWEW